MKKIEAKKAWNIILNYAIMNKNATSLNVKDVSSNIANAAVILNKYFNDDEDLEKPL